MGEQDYFLTYTLVHLLLKYNSQRQYLLLLFYNLIYIKIRHIGNNPSHTSICAHVVKMVSIIVRFRIVYHLLSNFQRKSPEF